MTANPQPQVRALVSWSTDPDATPAFVDLDAGAHVVQSLSTTLGRAYEQDTAQPGTLSLTLDGSSGDFVPDSTSSRYYPNVETDKRIQVQVTPPAPYDLTYVLFDGHINELPSEVADDGFDDPMTPLTALDYFEALGVSELQSTYASEVLASGPSAYYPCTDTAITTGVGSTVGNIAPTSALAAPLQYRGAPGGFAKLGGNAMLPADAGTSLELAPATALDSLGVSYPAGGLSVDLGAAGVLLSSTGGFTFEIVTDLALFPGYPVDLMAQVFKGLKGDVAIEVSAAGVQAGLSDGVTQLQPQLLTSAFTDGQPHHLALTLSADGTTAALYVDGASSGAVISSTPIRFPSLPAALVVGSSAVAGYSYGGRWVQGRIGHIATYSRALTQAEIVKHVTAMQGFGGELSGARVNRILDYAGFPAGRRQVDAGYSTTGPLLSGGVDALSLLQNVAGTEQGAIFMRGGQFVFRDRGDTLNANPLVTLGSPDLPVEGTGMRFSKDKQRIKNVITATRPNGPTLRLVNATSVRQHRPRTATITYEVFTDAALLSAASWDLFLYGNPRTRLPSIDLDPMTSPALWPWALGVQPLDLLTLTGLPLGSPAPTLSLVVQSVAHQASQQQWKTTLQLTPPVPPTLRISDPGDPYAQLDAGLVIPL